MFKRLLLATTFVLALAPAAARAGTSANWSGYVAHRAGVKFRKVSASWTQASASCTPGQPSYSADWVGLGGYSSSSQALEQIGTELDCGTSGRVVSSAWFELVPAPPSTIRLSVAPGDSMAATVSVIGHQVKLRLVDRTRHETFLKTFDRKQLDVTSADWIVEAPSECLDGYGCRTLPLADFGSVNFRTATAQTVSGRSGPISSSLWNRSKITLTPDVRTVAIYGSAGQSTPSALTDAGLSFQCDYSQVALEPVGPPPVFARLTRAGRHVQPGGRRR